MKPSKPKRESCRFCGCELSFREMVELQGACYMCDRNRRDKELVFKSKDRET